MRRWDARVKLYVALHRAQARPLLGQPLCDDSLDELVELVELLRGRSGTARHESSRGRTSGGGIHLTKKLPYVNHYSFHIMDAQWGHITIKMAGHPPFGAQIILNGHEYVACQANARHLTFTKEGNCFTQIADAADLASIADTLSEARTVGA